MIEPIVITEFLTWQDLSLYFWVLYVVQDILVRVIVAHRDQARTDVINMDCFKIWVSQLADGKKASTKNSSGQQRWGSLWLL